MSDGGVTPGRVLLIGAGGHARVCLDALRCAGGDAVGCVASNRPIAGLDLPWWGADDGVTTVVDEQRIDAVVLAIGHNEARQRLALLVDGSARWLPVVHPAAVLAASARIGAGAVVFAAAVINASADVGPGAIVNTAAVIEHDVQLGAFAHVAPAAVLAGGVCVGERAFVGVGARVLPGRRIGAGAIVGGGAVVTADVADGETVVGVPARVVGGHR